MSATIKAVRTLPVYDTRGRIVPMKAGPCLWCGEHVESGRDEAGAQDPYDPCWHVDGDFGCDKSPESSGDGCGDHARPYDLALRLMRR